MRVLAFPKGTSPYTECFYAAVEAIGVEVVDGTMSGGWLVQNVRRGDWVHLHWPSFEYSGSPGAMRQLLAFARFMLLLLLARVRGARIAWTAHNLMPHDRARVAGLDALARHAVVAFSDVVLVHGEQARDVLARRFPATRAKAIVIPHGNWIDHYPRTSNRATARSALGLVPDAWVYAFVGLCKPYKNLERLVHAFRSTGRDAILVIAGKFPDSSYLKRVRDAADGDPRIRILAGYVPDEQLGHYLVASDCVVAPYREILTSGTAMLAMSFGRPVVSLASGFLLEVIDERNGVLYEPADPHGLEGALERVRSRRYDEKEIIGMARGHTFEAAAAIFVAALQRFARGHGSKAR